MDAPAPFSHPLAYVRRSRGWTHQALVEVLARRVGMSANRQKAWRWEHRGVVPDEETQRALAEELGVPLDRLRSDPWPGWLPAGDSAGLDEEWTAAGCLRALELTTADALADHRGFPVLPAGAAAAMAGRLPPPSPGGGSGPGGAAEHGSAGPGTAGDAADGFAGDLVRSLEQRLPLLRRLDDELGGGGVRAPADAELRTVTALLRQGRHGGGHTRRLLSVAAELGRIAGWAGVDAGYHAAAQRYFTVGLRAAHAAGDRLAAANLLKCMTLQLAECGRPDEALALAGTARRCAAGGPGRVRAMLAVRHARAHALSGDRAACEKLLAEADGLMERAASEPCPGWAAYFDSAEYSAQVAFCHLLTGRHRLCDRRLTEALALQPPSRPRDGTTYRMWRAEAAVRLGEVDRACAELAEALPLVAGCSSARNRARLDSVRRLLRPYRTTRSVRALDERLRALSG
ncbi:MULTISPECIES: helix-turn-helix transcriptional regulator [Streptomyces]|uniref:helix-turn-helix domain-containing protein n=1 Tax=Streptomyces TaxID=1883 RepID=UPI001C3F6C26|nr:MULTISPECIES: helix-turn-helix transcriptional regulator [Streptomyces]